MHETSVGLASCPTIVAFELPSARSSVPQTRGMENPTAHCQNPVTGLRPPVQTRMPSNWTCLLLIAAAARLSNHSSKCLASLLPVVYPCPTPLPVSGCRSGLLPPVPGSHPSPPSYLGWLRIRRTQACPRSTSEQRTRLLPGLLCRFPPTLQDPPPPKILQLMLLVSTAESGRVPLSQTRAPVIPHCSRRPACLPEDPPGMDNGNTEFPILGATTCLVPQLVPLSF